MNLSTAPMRRRRFIAIAAAAAGLPLIWAGSKPAKGAQLHIWTGSALGADAMLQIHHPDPAVADGLIVQSLQEVERLERILSLYRPGSALVRLNNDGRLADPPPDLLRILSTSAQISDLTGGAFDATVQPLWNLYAAHFSAPAPDPAGPSRAAITEALSRVDYRRVELDPRCIRFTAPGMGMTLNGIGQGYVTDCVVARLKDAGIAHALVDMGETRAIGSHPAGTPWSIGLGDPRHPGHVAQRIALQDEAVSTSGGYGTEFDAAGRFNHIFDPSDGATSWRYLSVSVVASDTTTADAMSTAFSVMPLERARAVVTALGLRAYFTQPDGSTVMQGEQVRRG